MFALIVGGAIAGLLGAILALPIAATGRDVFRYLFRRLSPDEGGSLEIWPGADFSATRVDHPRADGAGRTTSAEPGTLPASGGR